MGRESTVWPETSSRGMPGPFRSLWNGSNPLQRAVPDEKWPCPGGLSQAHDVGARPNHQKWPEMDPKSTVWPKLGPEACQDCSGAFGMGLTHSKGPSPAKKVKKCAQAGPGHCHGPKTLEARTRRHPLPPSNYRPWPILSLTKSILTQHAALG